MVYKANLSEPLYLSVDASQVGVGVLLYQITLYLKTAEGEKTMLKDLGYLPSQNKEDYMILGISPGRNTPIITAFLQDKSQLSKYDSENLLSPNATMTEKLEKFQDFVFHVKPISWYSKTFTAGQVLKYNASEKEFLGVLMSIMNFRDYIETVPLTYILSDSQIILWALHHQSNSLKLQWALKVYPAPKVYPFLT